MAYLGAIISQLEKQFKLHVHGSADRKKQIEGIKFLTDSSSDAAELDSRLLYMGNYSDYYDVRFDGNVLLLNCKIMDMGENCLCIYQNPDIGEVFNVIQDEIMRYHFLKIKREELFHSLHSGNGIQGIVNVAYTCLGNPVTVCDTSFSIIGASPALDDERNLEKRNDRFYLKENFSQNMLDDKIIERIYHSPVPFITKIDDYSYDWVFYSIRIQHAVVGYVCVRALQKGLAEEDLEFIDVLSQMLSIEMQKDDSFSNPTGLKYEYFLTELLDGNFERTEYVTHHLIQLGHKPAPFYYILVFQFADTESRRPSIKSYYEQLLSILPQSMVVFFHGKLTVLLPVKSQSPFTEAMESRLYTFLRLNKMYAAISYPFSDITQSPYYFHQTNALFSIRGIEPDEKRMIHYGRHFLKHIFHQCKSPDLMKASIHPDILRIREYDRKNHTDYLHTLRAYLLHNRNAVAASGELHIHKSTFFYRLSKISDLFGFDINDGLTLFAYEYSFRAMDYLKNQYSIC